MTLNEAIKHAEAIANSQCGECAIEHLQLAMWLKELKVRREKDFETVEQKYGCWIVHHYLDTELECSKCQCIRTFERADLPKENYPKFCESCGAKMNEVLENEG